MKEIKRIIEVTTNIGCNINCDYCPQSKINKSYKKHSNNTGRLLSLDNFYLMMSSVPKDVDIHFSGFTEPFHNDDCAAMISHVSNKGHQVAVFTTADNMNEADIELISSIHYKNFCVHLPDNDRIMKLNVDKKYLNTLKKLLSSDIHKLNFLTLGEPHIELKKFIENINSSKYVHTRAGNISINSSIIKPAFSESYIYNKVNNKPISCRKDRNYANVLLPSGDLQICCMDYGLEEKIGNLFKTSYEEVLNGFLFKDTLNRMKENNGEILCRRCEYALPV